VSLPIVFVVFDPATSSLVQVGTSGFDQVYSTNNKKHSAAAGGCLGSLWQREDRDSLRLCHSHGSASHGELFPALKHESALHSAAGFNRPPPLTLMNAESVAGRFWPCPPAPFPTTFKNPYVQSWNLNVERELTPTVGLTVCLRGFPKARICALRGI